MNPLLIEALAKQTAPEQAPRRHLLIPASPRRRRSWVNRFGEVLIGLGTKLAFARFDPSFTRTRESW
jgi:hypothetical protein